MDTCHPHSSEKKNEELIKLHFGCGPIHKDGYVNIDIENGPAVDKVLNISIRLPYESNSVDLIEAHHVIEHIRVPFWKSDVPGYNVLKGYAVVIREWRRVLKPGGKLIIECPNFDGLVDMYVNGDNDALPQIFGHGDNDANCHHYGFNVTRLSKIFELAGFATIQFTEPKDHIHNAKHPSLRVEATKLGETYSKDKNFNYKREKEKKAEADKPKPFIPYKERVEKNDKNLADTISQ